MRRTKIIATVGPASNSQNILTNLLKAGVNIARFNFSHGTHQKHAETLHNLKMASKKTGFPVSLLLDLQGPKIRVGNFRSNGIFLKKNQKIDITTRDVIGDDTVIPVTFNALPQNVQKGNVILMDDGLLELVVTGVEDTEIHCQVRVGGPLTSNKGINLPGIAVMTPSLTAKDKKDLKFGLANDFDFIALSFVREAKDILELQEEIGKMNKQTPVIAKIEKPEACRNIEDIIATADGIMIARGDLGVEMGPEKVPIIQKKIVRLCIAANKPVIIATQMLESMHNNPRPTRAEASDVANAIFDGADAVMLSGETSVGKYPVEAVRMMVKIARQSEKHIFSGQTGPVQFSANKNTFPDAISEAACKAAFELKAKAIVAFTQSGFTAKLISKFRPITQIFAFTPDESVVKHLAIYWGVEAKMMAIVSNIDEMIKNVDTLLQKEKFVRKGDVIAILAGAPVGVPGTTNMLTLHRVGQDNM